MAFKPGENALHATLDVQNVLAYHTQPFAINNILSLSLTIECTSHMFVNRSKCRQGVDLLRVLRGS